MGHPSHPHLLFAGTSTDGQRLLLSCPQPNHTQAGTMAPSAPGAPQAWQCCITLASRHQGITLGSHHEVPSTGPVTGCDTSASSRDQQVSSTSESFVHFTFPTARPPTTERMTPQTLITRVCKTERAQHITGVTQGTRPWQPPGTQTQP